MDKWIKKIWCIYTMEYSSAIKKDEIMPIGDNIDGPQGHYAKWNKSDRERQTLYYLICIEIKKNLQKQNRLLPEAGSGEMGEGGSKGINF